MMFSLEDVAKHKNEDDCYIIIKNNQDEQLVYDVTRWLDQHPGGSEIIMEFGGKDATEMFYDIGHSNEAESLLKSFHIGRIGSQTKSPRSHMFIRQSSLKSQSICQICGDSVGLSENDIRLGCTCLIHSTCLGQYIKSKIGDKDSIIRPLEKHEKVELQHSGKSDKSVEDETIICPYYQPGFNECKFKETEIGKEDPDDKYFLTIIDLEFLLTKLKNLNEIIFTEEDILKLKLWLSEKNKSQEDLGLDLDDPFIEATTKPCPCIVDKKSKKMCNFRATHYHGHHCHHIRYYCYYYYYYYHYYHHYYYYYYY